MRRVRPPFTEIAPRGIWIFYFVATVTPAAQSLLFGVAQCTTDRREGRRGQA